MSSLVKQARKRPSKKERKRTQTKKTSQLFPKVFLMRLSRIFLTIVLKWVLFTQLFLCRFLVSCSRQYFQCTCEIFTNPCFWLFSNPNDTTIRDHFCLFSNLFLFNVTAFSPSWYTSTYYTTTTQEARRTWKNAKIYAFASSPKSSGTGSERVPFAFLLTQSPIVFPFSISRIFECRTTRLDMEDVVVVFCIWGCCRAKREKFAIHLGHNLREEPQ